MPRRHQTPRRAKIIQTSEPPQSPPSDQSITQSTVSSQEDEYCTNLVCFSIPLAGEVAHWRHFEDYYECLNRCLAESLRTQPLPFMHGAYVSEMTVSGRLENSAAFFDVAINLDRELSSSQLSAPVSHECANDMQGRIGTANDYCRTLQTNRHDAVTRISLTLSTKHSVRTPTQPIKWTIQSNPCEIRGVLRSVQCAKGHQSQWNTFLQQINRCVAKVLADAPNNEAKSIILSNHEGNLCFTVKFSRPCPPLNVELLETVEESISKTIQPARMLQISKYHDRHTYKEEIAWMREQLKLL